MAFLGEGIGKLGFGLMRLPRVEGSQTEIDVEQTKRMVDMFIGAGFNYFDTAWAYAGSEEATKLALVDRYPRESFKLATKLAAWIQAKSREEAIGQFERSLERSGAGYFDFYLLHNLGDARTEVFEQWELWSWGAQMKREGRIKHLGFSFHSTPQQLDEILHAHPEAEFVQLQINYADWEDSSIQSRACYEVARRHGKPVIIMEPVKGGMLATPPESVRRILADAEPESSPASWAVRFAADLDGVITVLSGMSSTEQMADNVSYMKGFTHLTDAQRAVIAGARDEIAKIPMIPCTSCSYCVKVCPNNICIPQSMSGLNYLSLYGNLALAKHQLFLGEFLFDAKRPSECVKCGACEEACPQHIKIRDELERAVSALEG